MKITKISIEGLFGIFNHVIPIKTEDHITIIHGPNGFGKTAVLKLVDGLFNNEFAEFRKIPFAEFKVDFDDESFIKVEKVRDEKQKKTTLIVTSYQGDQKLYRFLPN